MTEVKAQSLFGWVPTLSRLNAHKPWRRAPRRTAPTLCRRMRGYGIAAITECALVFFAPREEEAPLSMLVRSAPHVEGLDVHQL